MKRTMKQKVIGVSLKYNLVSQFTSFIAVEDEKDFSTKDAIVSTPHISEIAGRHIVDKLNCIFSLCSSPSCSFFCSFFF